MRPVATAAAILGLTCGSAVAAEAPKTFLYTVNGTGRPFQMSVDAEKPSPPMGHLVGAMLAVKPGSHQVTGTVDGEAPTSTTLVLNEADLAIAGKTQIGLWCVVVGRRSNAELVFVTASPPECGAMVLGAIDGKAKP
jgi:hypothetical protein